MKKSVQVDAGLMKNRSVSRSGIDEVKASHY